ncbi:MAG: DUF6531 domain-containing protein [Gammaproteobacteria bacterium]|nr:DUF6531 domain-containing protein [Gammaproteobacteria bacterium]
MLDSPAKNLTVPITPPGQILWRGSNWLLFKPESQPEGAERHPPVSYKHAYKKALSELTDDLLNNQRLSSQLRNTLDTLDESINPVSDSPGAGANQLLQRVSALVQQGNLQWLPCEPAATDDNQPPPVGSDSSGRRRTGHLEKKTPQKNYDSRHTANRQPGPEPSNGISRRVEPSTSTKTATQHPNQRKNPPPLSKRQDTGADSDKSLIERFTHADAVTGEPVSRWLACAGRVPVTEVFTGISSSKNKISAKSAHKTTHKPGKLGNGLISLKNSRRCTNHRGINLVNGEELLTQTDIDLPGPIPLLWQRTYRTSHRKDFGLGIGWTSQMLSRLELRENEIIFQDGDGRDIPFERLADGESCHNVIEQLNLYCDDKTVYRIVDTHNNILTFGGSGIRRRLYEIADRYGHAIKLFYSANDRLIQILDSAGRRLKMNHTISGQLQNIFLCDEQGGISGKPLVEYKYDNDGDLIQAIDANGNIQSFEYRYHNIIKHTSKDGFSFRFQWDEYTIKGKCTRNWGDNDIYDYHFKYDDVNKITRSKDALGNTSEYHYNELGLITTQIDAEGGVSQYTYSREGRLLSERNPIGNTTQFRYDTNGRLTRRVDATGAATEFEYDSADNLVRIVAPMEREWERQYDAQGHMTLSKDPGGHTTHYQYDANGWVCAITDCLDRTRRFQWNEKGECLWQSDAAGNKTHYAYDALGRITKITEGDNHTTHYSYDRMNSVTQIILPNGASVQMHYTPQGNLTQYIDAVGRSTRYKYDGLNQPVEKIDPGGQRLQFEYDKQRNLTAVVNENAERHELQYDKNQRLINETGFDGRLQQYGYNAAGQLVRYLDGAHRVTSFKRDPMGRLLQKRTSTGEITQYEYDAAGQLSKAYNSHCVLHFRYDGLGQLIGEMQNNQRIQHRYNAPGQRTHTILPNGRTIRYDYDERGLLTRVCYSGRVLCKMTHDRFGLETHRTTGEVSSKFEYDPLGRLLHQHASNPHMQLIDRSYRYDKAGNLRQIDDLTDGRMKFHYDALDRLEKIERSLIDEFQDDNDAQFTFDPAGNLLDSQYPEPDGFVQGNRLRVFHNYRFEYDDVGNLVRQFQGRLETRFYYNVANQLVRVNKNAQTIEYSYDPLGRRIKKHTPWGDTVYLWDGERLICEQQLVGNEEQRDEGSVILLYKPGRSIPLCQLRGDEVYYFHTDQQGTPRIITRADGEIVWQARYKAYGAVARLEVDDIDNAIGFHTHYYDSETGLLYGRQRYYHPVIGRFVQQNPRSLRSESNHYLYQPTPATSAIPSGITAHPGNPARRDSPERILENTLAPHDQTLQAADDHILERPLPLFKPHSAEPFPTGPFSTESSPAGPLPPGPRLRALRLIPKP